MKHYKMTFLLLLMLNLLNTYKNVEKKGVGLTLTFTVYRALPRRRNLVRMAL